jgi:sialic acid synthase SpsE
LKIDNFDLNKRVFIIAEAGINHEGNFENALRLIEDAAYAGVDCVKFQSYHTDKFISRDNKVRYDQRKKYELSLEQTARLSEYAGEKGLLFLSTALDTQSADEIEDYVVAFKVSSLDTCNYKLLECLLDKQKPLIISTGMQSDEDIKETIDFIMRRKGEEYLKSSVILLHCISSYPVLDPSYLNLLSIPYLKKQFNVNVGYSDHSLGTLACFAAVSLGARVIEKHFTIDQKMTGVRDHALSADKNEMKAIVEGIRYIEKSLGRPEKLIADVEQESKKSMKRVFVLNERLKQDSVISGKYLESVVNASDEGITCNEYFKIVGKRLKRDKSPFDLLLWEDIE